MLAVVAGVACVLAVLREAWVLLVLPAVVLIGPVAGGCVQVARGRGAIEGSIAGGILCYVGYGIVFAVGSYSRSLDIHEVLFLLVVPALAGVVVGTFVGVAIDFTAVLVRSSIAFVKTIADALRPGW
jgi:hypothetical protein